MRVVCSMRRGHDVVVKGGEVVEGGEGVVKRWKIAFRKIEVR